MPLPSFATGFVLGFSLILAIGAQNAFVLRQGLLRRHVFVVVLFCALADMLLIVAGVAGVSLMIADFAERHAPLLFGIAALWLAAYGGLRLRSAVRAGSALAGEGQEGGSLAATVATVAILTFGNPHVYLDTVVLIGTVSLVRWCGQDRLWRGRRHGQFRVLLWSWLWRQPACTADAAAQCLAGARCPDRSGDVHACAWNGACRRMDRRLTGVTPWASHLVQILVQDGDLDMEADIAVLIILEDNTNEFVLQHQVGRIILVLAARQRQAACCRSAALGNSAPAPYRLRSWLPHFRQIPFRPRVLSHGWGAVHDLARSGCASPRHASAFRKGSAIARNLAAPWRRP